MGGIVVGGGVGLGLEAWRGRAWARGRDRVRACKGNGQRKG